jgi:dihydroxyacetone kinase-like protein
MNDAVRPGPAGQETVGTAALERWLRAFAAVVHEQRDFLTELDSAIGDADHGANMDRGMAAVVARLEAQAGAVAEAGSGTGSASGAGAGTGTASGAAAGAEGPGGPAAVLKQTGMTLVSSVGGASGPLYGTLFLRMATAAGDVAELDGAALAKALRAGLEGVVARGRAESGDKTMFDALAPACDALEQALADGSRLAAALQSASAAADAGRDATIAMLARKGRASYLGERSVGHQDPGATSAALLVAAAARALVAPAAGAPAASTSVDRG